MKLVSSQPQTDLDGESVFSSAEFERFQEFFYRDTGIIFGSAKRYFVDRRVTDRMARCGAASLGAYLNHLRYADPNRIERQALINALTVNETYFYREEYQLRCLVNSILPEIIEARANDLSKPLRIWSLPCSTGEEPYSIAIYLLESWSEVDRYDIEILGSDIDTAVLARASIGMYGDRAIQLLPLSVRSKYFRLQHSGQWQIIEGLRGSVEFKTVNLSDRESMRAHRAMFDVIFCRNLLIYFDEASRRWAAEALYDSLRPGGFLCLGHSESMSRISSAFILRKYSDAIVYQKPED